LNMGLTRTIDRLHAWAVGQPTLRVFTLILRVMLALAFLPSGLVKIMGEPFTTLPVTDPVGYFFAGFFSVRGYYRFVGVTQWVAGGLLLIPSTATLGALLYLPISVNIFAITVGIGAAFAGTRLVTGAMVLANVYLLWWDWDRWKRILPVAGPVRADIQARHGDLITTLGTMTAAGIGFAGISGAHLARLRHTSYAGPLAMVAVGTTLGLMMLVRAYRRAGARPSSAISPRS
jgi:hypothetical protein